VTAQSVHDPSFEPWRGRALERGYQSVAAIPLAHEETVHGVLCVYANCPDAFDDTERTLLAELGSAVGRALGASQGGGRREVDSGTGPGSDAGPEGRRSHTVTTRAAAMAASTDGMAVLGPDGRFEYLNEAHARLYGYDDPATLVGESWRRLYGPDERARFETDVLPEARRVGQWRGEARGKKADGTKFPQEVSLTTLDGPELVCVVRDITRRRETERELERRNRRLDEFASVVSHDLRGPLSVATGSVELARRTASNTATEERLDAVDAALDRIDGLVQDVLSLARGETDEEGSVVSLERTVADCWRDDGERVTVEADLRFVADRGRLQRLFENLFRNSVEHGWTDDRPQPDGVELTVGPLDERDGFFVADDGGGIPPDVRERVFEPGYTTSDAGTGLGLDIVERIADDHDWDCRVTESVAGGARFEFAGVDVFEGTAAGEAPR
jgi:PAS domain S-box-containing protein